VGTRPRTADEQARLDAAGRTTRRVAIAALVLSLVGVGMAAWRTFAPSDGGCQSAAWSVSPGASDLPAGWTVASSQYDIARKSLSLVGPLPADETAAQAVIYATITCYPVGAADAVTRSADAATAAGQLVTRRDDLGDQGFSAVDDSGATFLQVRHADLVIYLAASGDATAPEVDQLASAFDRAMGGDGGAVSIGSPAPASQSPGTGPTDTGSGAPLESALPSAAAAPVLEAALPRQVGSVALAVDSATGSMILGEDQLSRAIVAALRAEGRQPDDLSLAQAYDETAESDLSILAVSVNGMPIAKTLRLVMDSWLAASGTGVTRDTATLDGRTFTRINYGDDGPLDYVIAQGEIVIVITTADPALAAQAAAALP
jgi:hypothetical protein